ncbi:MAG: glycosyltransferase family 4 protein [Nitrospirae bacterium]|nr:glycosyltransferase family 4 protein [Candidatus Manganitrophaceae bacterium]
MKIAFVRKSYRFHGGAEQHLTQLMLDLQRAGHEVHLFAHQWTGDRLAGITFHPVPMIGGLSFLKVLTFAWFAKRRLRGHRFDIVQSLDKTVSQDIYWAEDGCHRAWLSARTKRLSPFQRFLVFLNPLHWLILRIESRIFKRGNYKKIIAISKQVKEEIVQLYPVRPDDVTVIYNGVDLERFHPRNREASRGVIRKRHQVSESQFLLLFVGSGFERKGLRCVIEALGVLKTPEIVLFVLGRGRSINYLQRAAQLGIGASVRFLGPQKQIEKYYASADLFVFPTLYEPFGQVHLEAMASGLPVITNAGCGGAEIVREGENGALLKDPTDSLLLAEKINSFYNEARSDPRFMERTGRAARREAERYPPEKAAREMVALYREIVAGGRPDC